jgi:hypothetical protein
MQPEEDAEITPTSAPDSAAVSDTAPDAPRDKAAHLKAHRWEKGRSGNPGGRPKGKSITAALRELSLTEHNGKTLVQLLAERLYKDALSGKFPQAKEIIERLDGKVADHHKVEATSEQTVYVCPPPRVIGEDTPRLEKRADEPGDGEE